MDLKITDNKDQKRYEAQIENKTAFIEYISTKESIYLTHTEVPTSLEGKRIGTSLVRGVLEIVVENNLKLAPLCPFVAAYIKRNPDRYKGILARGYNV
jgi:predicted GNAT family acetyltransferase